MRIPNIKGGDAQKNYTDIKNLHKRKVKKMQMYRQIDFKPEEVLLYSRKSRTDDPTLTVEEILQKHEAILDEWAEKNLGKKVPEKNKFREVVSGETLKERPEIQKVLRMIESPKFKAVLIVEPQRLTRGDLEDIGRLMKLLKHTNTYVITPERIYDLRDDYDWDAFERELKRGNEYLEYTKKILNRGKLLSVSQGNYLGTIAPYGYDRCTVMDGKRKCPTLKENKEQADVVRLIFDLYVNQNLGRQRIANHLNNLHIKAPKGERWVPSGIKDMLRNIHYIGKVRWNWRKTITIVEDGEFLKTRPHTKVGEYLVFEGKHQGIVPVDLYNAAQEKTGKNPPIKPEAKARNPFAGILYCECGKAMVLKHNRRKDGPDRNAPRMLCPAQAHCRNASCFYQDMIDRICAILEQCIEDFEIRIKNDEGDSTKLHANLIKNLEKQMKDLQEKELKQWEMQSDPDETKRMPQEIFQQLNARLLKEKEEIQQALCKAYESMPEPVNYEEKIVTFKKALDALRDPNEDAMKKNSLLKACIERIEYKKEKGQRLPVKNSAFESGWTETPILLDVKLKV